MTRLSATRVFSAMVMAISALIATTPNARAVLIDPEWYTSLPSCSEAKVLEKIVARFNEAERSLWRTGARLRSISGPHEHAYNVYAHSTINRRYCQAKAWLKSGHSRRVYYVIEQGMGLAGFGWEVGYCLKGSDRWHAYDGWCRVLRK